MRAIDPAVPTREMRGLGEMLRHEYRHINRRVIFDTVTNDLPSLRAACEVALASRD